MKKLYFVRHGESEDNATQVWSRPDTPLTDNGRLQALESAKSIKKQDLFVDLIVVSTLPRAMETAHIIATNIGYPLDKIQSSDLFVERVWGDITGTHHSLFFDGTKTRQDMELVQGMEKLEDLQSRARKGMDYLRSRPEGIILLVGHGTYGRALRRALNGQPHTDEFEPELVRFSNGEVAELI